MATKPKAGVLTHGELQDVKIAMDKFVELQDLRDCKVKSATILLDTGRVVLVAQDDDELWHEVSLA